MPAIVDTYIEEVFVKFIILTVFPFQSVTTATFTETSAIPDGPLKLDCDPIPSTTADIPDPAFPTR